MDCADPRTDRLGSDFLHFVCTELGQIEKPGNPGQVYKFRNLEVLGQLLIDFLAFPVSEMMLDRIESNFWEGIEPFLRKQLEQAALPSSVERLATTFESFLKKIAYFRYEGDVLRWSGDGLSYSGLARTMLADLIAGRVAKTKAGEAAPDLAAPIVDARGVKGAIHGRTREIRNTVHEARDYPLTESLRAVRNVIASYLIAVEDNQRLLRQLIYPEYDYLNDLVDRFHRWETQYIELVGEEERFLDDIQVLDPVAVEWKDDTEIASASTVEDEENEFQEEVTSTLRRESVFQIIRDVPQCVIIGSPGAGKTTTLQRIAFDAAKQVLEDNTSTKPIPVLIEANRYAASTTFMRLLSVELGMADDTVQRNLRVGRILVLVDGLNEIAAQDQEPAWIELRNLVAEFQNTRFIFTARKIGYRNVARLPAFELQELTDAQIEAFITAGFARPERGQALVRLLMENPKMMSMVRNPLLLRMFVIVGTHHGVPDNRGELLQRFIQWIISRERKVRQTDAQTKEDVLAWLAYQMRVAGRVQVEKSVALAHVFDRLHTASTTIGVNDLFAELVENGLLRVSTAGDVTYFHELAQEYFAAVELSRVYLLDNSALRPFLTDFRWEEPLLMLAGFLRDPSSLIEEMAHVNLLLSAKCARHLKRQRPSIATMVLQRVEYELERAQSDVKHQTWTRVDLRGLAESAGLLEDSISIKRLLVDPYWKHYHISKILSGLENSRSKLAAALLAQNYSAARIESRFTYQQWLTLCQNWLLPEERDQVLQLFADQPGAYTFGAALLSDPEQAFAIYKRTGKDWSFKTLRRALRGVQLEAPVLIKLFATTTEPLRLAVAIRLAGKDDSIVPYLVEKVIEGKKVEANAALQALALFSDDTFGGQLPRIKKIPPSFLKGHPKFFSSEAVRVSEAVQDALDELLNSDNLADVRFAKHFILDHGVFELFSRTFFSLGRRLLSLLEETDVVPALQTDPRFRQLIMECLESENIDELTLALAQIVAQDLSDEFALTVINRLERLNSLKIEEAVAGRVRQVLASWECTGIVYTYFPDRGFGFVWCYETNGEYLFHISEVEIIDPEAMLFATVRFLLRYQPSSRGKFVAGHVRPGEGAWHAGVIQQLSTARGFGEVLDSVSNEQYRFYLGEVEGYSLSQLCLETNVEFLVVPRREGGFRAVRVSPADLH